jgi:hypothetical protein
MTQCNISEFCQNPFHISRNINHLTCNVGKRNCQNQSANCLFGRQDIIYYEINSKNETHFTPSGNYSINISKFDAPCLFNALQLNVLNACNCIIIPDDVDPTYNNEYPKTIIHIDKVEFDDLLPDLIDRTNPTIFENAVNSYNDRIVDIVRNALQSVEQLTTRLINALPPKKHHIKILLPLRTQNFEEYHYPIPQLINEIKSCINRINGINNNELSTVSIIYQPLTGGRKCLIFEEKIQNIKNPGYANVIRQNMMFVLPDNHRFRLGE